MSLRRREYLREMKNTKAHKTAISRPGKLSAPMKKLMSKGLLVGRVLDYGCGRGQDATRAGAEKYDPHFFPQKPQGQFDTIACNYVLNVVKPRRGREIIAKIRKLLKPGGNAYITVRRDVKDAGFTSRGTYQRDVRLKLPVILKGSGFETYHLKG